MCKHAKSLLLLSLSIPLLFLAGCNKMAVLDPKGPVAALQKDLILLSVYFMLAIVAVVFILFAFMLVKYRERPGNEGYDPPEMEGNKFLEIVWTVIPILIVTALSFPTVKAIYALEGPHKETAHLEPLVIHATSVDWKWIFSYPEEEIETVNYLHIPTGRPILFKLSSADSMAALWIPQLGGQKYTMSGMGMELYLQADEPGSYEGRNSNFTGEGFAEQVFRVVAEPEEEFQSWVKAVKGSAPRLTQEQYDRLMLPGHVEEMSFSSTHLKWVDHATDAEYAMRVRKGLERPAKDEIDVHYHSDPKGGK